MKAALDLLDKYNAEDDDDMSIEVSQHYTVEMQRG